MPPGRGGLVLLALALTIGTCRGLPLELTAANITSTFQGLPGSRWVVMEFYAHWCPHCQRFQPIYNQVSDHFDALAAVDPPSAVTVARLDCAENAEACNAWDVSHYPTLKMGRAADFAAQAKDKLAHLDARDAQGTINAISKHIGIAPQLLGDTLKKAVPAGDEHAAVHTHTHLQILKPEVERADLVDIEGATLKSWEYAVAASALMRGPDARVALHAWLAGLARAHPLARCREGAAAIAAAMASQWPEGQGEPSSRLGKMPICGAGAEFKGWSRCKGSLPLTRGYTCGLWQLFHTLAARLPDAEGAGAAYIAMLRGFVQHYFQCKECATHFLVHLGEEAALGVASRRDAARWLWATHNKVNERLSAEDKGPGSDPRFPHVQWPTHELCGGCRRGGRGEGEGWAEEELLRFLENYYGFGAESGSLPEARSLQGTGGRRTAAAGWLDAGGLCTAVLVVVYLALRNSGQYTLRRAASSRLL